MSSAARKRSRTGSAAWSAAPVEAVTALGGHAEVLPEPGRPWRRLLRIDGEDVSHVDLQDPRQLEFAYLRRIGDLVDAVRPPGVPLRVLHIGGGGFTLPRYVQATRPGSNQEVAELDPVVLQIARDHLGLRTSPRLRVRVADGRAVLARRPPGGADLVVLDAFDGAAVPAHLATVECAALARRALQPDGVLAVNVIDDASLRAARERAATLLEVLPVLAVVGARKVLRGRQGGNVVLLASSSPLPARRLAGAALRGAAPELVLSGSDARAFAEGADPRHDSG